MSSHSMTGVSGTINTVGAQPRFSSIKEKQQQNKTCTAAGSPLSESILGRLHPLIIKH